MAAKLVVTASKGGSRIALVGASGTELLSSRVFSEPRAKGATLRSLKGIHSETAMPTLAAESSLAKDWLTPEEDAAWANL